MNWIDLTIPIKSGMTGWPGDPPVSVERFSDQEKGDGYNASRLLINTHTGTHIDAPMHFINDGDGIDKLPIEVVTGPARVIEITDPHSITPEELESHGINEGERLLFKTANSRESWCDTPFREDYVALSTAGAGFLAEKHIRLVGTDYFSAALFGEEASETHKMLLGSGIWIVEGLILSGIEPGDYELLCLPLRIDNCDGSPARVLIAGI